MGAGDARIPLLKAGLFVAGCGVGGFCLGCLIAAMVARHIADGVTTLVNTAQGGGPV